jgi:hypothetical protein
MRANLLVFLLFVQSVFSQSINHWETAIYPSDNWRYRVNETATPTGWNLSNFDDSQWSLGQGGFGYGDNDDATTVPNCISVSIRTTFNVSDINEIAMAVLSVDYDDAFIAWINGVEIARSAGLQGVNVNWDTPSSENREAVMYTGGRPTDFLIKKEILASALRNGNNVLAIEVHNTSSGSSDLTIIPYLSVGITVSNSYYRLTPDWFNPPVTALSSNLPIVIIDTHGQTVQSDNEIVATMKVVDKRTMPNSITDNEFTYNGSIHFEYRGQSTLWNDWPKKSYNVELINAQGENIDSALMGMPAGNDWALYGPYNDKSLIRNALAYEIGRRMGHYAPRTAFCELVLNEQYAGLYLLIEKIRRDKNRVNIAKLTQKDISGDELTGGYIIKIDKGDYDEFGWISPYMHNGKPIHFLWHYPKPENILPVQKNYIRSYITSFENTLNSSFWNDPFLGYYRYINMASAVDYFLVNELSKNIDAYRISTFLHKDKDSKGGKLTFGPMWDYDLTFGNANYYSGDSPQGWVYKSISTDDYYQPPFWWDKFTTDDKFNNMVRCRWEELKNSGVLTRTGAHTIIDSMTTLIQDARIRNYNTFNSLGIWVWPNAFVGSTYEQEVNYLKNFVSSRLLWLDANLPGVCKDEPNPIMISAIPNPFNEYLDLRVILPELGRITLKITTISGFEVWQMSEQASLTSFVYRYQAQNLQKGIYVITTYLNGKYLGAVKVIKI